MTEMIVVEDRNQDDMSRKAGCYLYTDTRLWLENDQVHRGDGPAVVSPDGVERWYIRYQRQGHNARREHVLLPEQMAGAAWPGYTGENVPVPDSISQMSALATANLATAKEKHQSMISSD